MAKGALITTPGKESKKALETNRGGSATYRRIRYSRLRGGMGNTFASGIAKRQSFSEVPPHG